MKIREKMKEALSHIEEKLSRIAGKLQPQNGAGVVELVLIIVVLISLVLIFKSQLTSLMTTIFNQINSSATSVF